MATQTQTKTQYPSQTTHTYASPAASTLNSSSSSSGSPSTSAFGIKLDLSRSSSPGPSHEDNTNTPPVPPPKDTPLRRHTSLSMPIPVISNPPHGGPLPDKEKDANPDTDLLDPSSAHALRIVRFDNECVLIPDVQEVQHSRLLPMVVTKSYSLPLWKRRNPSPSPVRQSPNSGPSGVIGAMGASATTNELDVVDEDEDDPSGSSSSAVDVGSAVQEERERVVLKVPIPLFRRRSSRSPTRSPSSFSPLSTSPTKSRFRSHSTSPTIPKKLPPSCLVHRSTTQAQAQAPLSTIKDTDTDTLLLPASLPPLAPVRRRASLSSSITSSVSASSSIHTASSPGIYAKRPSDQTIPLRACCAACEHAMDAYLLQGDKYEEKFTRGARRRSRRSASLDSGGGHNLHSGPALPLSLTSSLSSAFTATYTPAKPRSPSAMQTQFADLSRGVDGSSSLLGSASPTSPASPSPLSLGPLGVRASTSTKNKFGLTVDEVDKRRKSADWGLSVVGTTVGGGIREEEGEGEGGNGDGDGDGEVVEGGVQELLEPFEAAVPLSTESPPLGGGDANTRLMSARYNNGNGGQVKKPKAAPLGPRRRIPSSPSSNTNNPYFPPTTSSTQDALRASPIPEETLTPTRYDEEDEDESMLFPLPTPSPRRSPCGTPTVGSSPVLRAQQSGLASLTPNGSRVSLLGGGNAGTGSSPTFVEARGGLGVGNANGNTGNGNGGGGGSRNSSQESLLKASLSRRVSPLYLDMSVMPLSSSSGAAAAAESERSKKNGVGLGLASPKGPRSPMVPTAAAAAAGKRWSPSASPNLGLAGPSTPPPGGISLNEDVTASAVVVGSSPPKPLVPLRASTPVISSSSPPKPSSSAQAHTSTPSSLSSSSSSPIPIPIPSTPKPSHTIFHNHTHTPTQTSASGTPSTPNTQSTLSSPQKRKLSFTFPFIRAGEAVLKGVSSIGGMGSVGGV